MIPNPPPLMSTRTAVVLLLAAILGTAVATLAYLTNYAVLSGALASLWAADRLNRVIGW